eukprot:1079814-Amphidinium_carterae.1
MSPSSLRVITLLALLLAVPCHAVCISPPALPGNFTVARNFWSIFASYTLEENMGCCTCDLAWNENQFLSCLIHRIRELIVVNMFTLRAAIFARCSVPLSRSVPFTVMCQDDSGSSLAEIEEGSDGYELVYDGKNTSEALRPWAICCVQLLIRQRSSAQVVFGPGRKLTSGSKHVVHTQLLDDTDAENSKRTISALRFGLDSRSGTLGGIEAHPAMISLA